MWVDKCGGYTEKNLLDAAGKALEIYKDRAPTIGQFLDIVKPISRHEYLEKSTLMRLESSQAVNFHGLKPSKFVIDYMAQNPEKVERDKMVLEELKSKYSGKELSMKIIREIRQRLSGKYAKSR